MVNSVIERRTRNESEQWASLFKLNQVNVFVLINYYNNCFSKDRTLILIYV